MGFFRFSQNLVVQILQIWQSKASKVLASRLIRIFIDKEIYKTKENDKLD
jgi:hypothetical protein